MTKAKEIATRLQRYSDSEASMLGLLQDEYPFPQVDSLSSDTINGANDAHLLRPVDYSPTLPTANLLISPSCTGQDTIIDMLSRRHPISSIKTGTTRKLREGEGENAYLWMDKPEGLSVEEEISHLIKKYDLLECQPFGGNYYGTPMSSVQESLANEDGGIVIIKNDQYGAPQIADSLRGVANANTIAMLPDSYIQLWERLINGGRTEPILRLAEAALFTIEFQDVSNYLLFNRERKNGPEITADSLHRIIQHPSISGGEHASA